MTELSVLRRFFSPGRRLGAAAALGAVLLAAPPAGAAPWWDVGFDAVVLRPLNAAAVVMGGVFFAASTPLVAIASLAAPPHELDLATPYDVFVYAPYEYTFLRELGDF